MTNEFPQDVTGRSPVDIAEIETPDNLPTGDVEVLEEADPAAEVQLEVVSDEVAETPKPPRTPAPTIPTPQPSIPMLMRPTLP